MAAEVALVFVERETRLFLNLTRSTALGKTATGQQCHKRRIIFSPLASDVIFAFAARYGLTNHVLPSPRQLHNLLTNLDLVTEDEELYVELGNKVLCKIARDFTPKTVPGLHQEKDALTDTWTAWWPRVRAFWAARPGWTSRNDRLTVPPSDNPVWVAWVDEEGERLGIWETLRRNGHDDEHISQRKSALRRDGAFWQGREQLSFQSDEAMLKNTKDCASRAFHWWRDQEEETTSEQSDAGSTISEFSSSSSLSLASPPSSSPSRLSSASRGRQEAEAETTESTITASSRHSSSSSSSASGHSFPSGHTPTISQQRGEEEGVPEQSDAETPIDCGPHQNQANVLRARPDNAQTVSTPGGRDVEPAAQETNGHHHADSDRTTGYERRDAQNETGVRNTSLTAGTPSGSRLASSSPASPLRSSGAHPEVATGDQSPINTRDGNDLAAILADHTAHTARIKRQWQLESRGDPVAAHGLPEPVNTQATNSAATHSDAQMPLSKVAASAKQTQAQNDVVTFRVGGIDLEASASGRETLRHFNKTNNAAWRRSMKVQSRPTTGDQAWHSNSHHAALDFASMSTAGDTWRPVEHHASTLHDRLLSAIIDADLEGHVRALPEDQLGGGSSKRRLIRQIQTWKPRPLQADGEMLLDEFEKRIGLLMDPSRAEDRGDHNAVDQVIQRVVQFLCRLQSEGQHALVNSMGGQMSHLVERIRNTLRQTNAGDRKVIEPYLQKMRSVVKAKIPTVSAFQIPTKAALTATAKSEQVSEWLVANHGLLRPDMELGGRVQSSRYVKSSSKEMVQRDGLLLSLSGRDTSKTTAGLLQRDIYHRSNHSAYTAMLAESSSAGLPSKVPGSYPEPSRTFSRDNEQRPSGSRGTGGAAGLESDAVNRVDSPTWYTARRNLGDTTEGGISTLAVRSGKCERAVEVENSSKLGSQHILSDDGGAGGEGSPPVPSRELHDERDQLKCNLCNRRIGTRMTSLGRRCKDHKPRKIGRPQYRA